jgi:putative SOS response-associated peptidase YedK
MCNLFENTVSFADLVRAFAGEGRPILKPAPQSAPNRGPFEQIRPTDSAPIVRRFGEGAQLLTMRWGLRGPRPKSGPVTNFRSEGRRFDDREDRGRCLAPATAFYEFTGSASPKTRWRFTETGRPWFCLAGVWRADEDGQARFSLLTIDPGPDMAPYHNRQVVVLPRPAWGPWLAGADEAALLRAGPAGALTVTRASPALAPAPSLPLFGEAL